MYKTNVSCNLLGNERKSITKIENYVNILLTGKSE